jgi:hypothetical protein
MYTSRFRTCSLAIRFFRHQVLAVGLSDSLSALNSSRATDARSPVRNELAEWLTFENVMLSRLEIRPRCAKYRGESFEQHVAINPKGGLTAKD